MANPEHLAKLKEGVQAWNEWRHNDPRLLPTLTGADLREADLREADLLGATLSGANLFRTDIRGADLTGADLREADLREADLLGATLSGANLFRTDIRGADLTGADLREADLRGATLSRTNLFGTDLRGADLAGADLLEAHLRGTNLARTQFTDTILASTMWCDVDLSEAVNLESILHFGPSTVGIDTLLRSKGRIPDAFLRGCGVPEHMIGMQKSLVGDASPIQFYSCFISYSHEDKPFAQALHDALQAKGIRCWLDEKQLLPGDDVHEQINRGIRLWDKVLFCASKPSLTSWWVDKELATAFAKEVRLMKERGKKVLALVPLNLDGFLFKWENGKAEEVRARFAPDFTAWRSEGFDFPNAIDPLIKALRADDGGREPVPPSQL